MTLECVKDPSAGSPTETLVRLLLPVSDEVRETSENRYCEAGQINLRMIHRITQSAEATSGVHKGAGT